MLSFILFLVVYRTIPTSNHNLLCRLLHLLVLYIVLFLHQTTTCAMSAVIFDSCISYYSYIKPQPSHHFQVDGSGCISYYSYIKPQPELATRCFNEVVYRTIPTSNHNVLAIIFVSRSVVYRTIPTSNHNYILSLNYYK